MLGMQCRVYGMGCICSQRDSSCKSSFNKGDSTHYTCLFKTMSKAIFSCEGNGVFICCKSYAARISLQQKVNSRATRLPIETRQKKRGLFKLAFNCQTVDRLVVETSVCSKFYECFYKNKLSGKHKKRCIL